MDLSWIEDGDPPPSGWCGLGPYVALKRSNVGRRRPVNIIRVYTPSWAKRNGSEMNALAIRSYSLSIDR